MPKKNHPSICVEQLQWLHKLLLYYSAHQKQLQKEIQDHEKILFG